MLKRFLAGELSLLMALAFVGNANASSLPVLTPALSSTTAANTENGSARLGYVLGPGDQIDINVFDYGEFTGQKVILPDGTITLPLIGAVPAANRTPEQLKQDLTVRLQEWLKNPVVTIGIIKLRPLQITVAGEVQRPGPIQLSSLTDQAAPGSNTPTQVPTVTTALLQAGGITRNADIRQVSLKRITPDGNTQTITVDLWNAIATDNAPRDFMLQDGDSVFVPRLAEGDIAAQRLAAKSSLAPLTIRVRVVGEVKQAGEVEVSPTSSLSGAIAIAGGPTDKAALKHVHFIRLGEDGRVQEQEVDLRKLTDTYQIQEGDVIVVPKKSGSKILDIGGQLFSPIFSLFNLFK